MILNIRTIINRGNDNLRGDIYNNLHDIHSIFHSNPKYYLNSVSITVSYIKNNKRNYIFLLKSKLREPEDVMAIIYFIEYNCKVRGIDFSEVDRLFVRLSILTSVLIIIKYLCLLSGMGLWDILILKDITFFPSRLFSIEE